MFDENQYLDKVSAASASLGPYRNPTVTERLKRQKKELEDRLSEITGVLEALESNPEVQRVVDAVSKIRGL